MPLLFLTGVLKTKRKRSLRRHGPIECPIGSSTMDKESTAGIDGHSVRQVENRIQPAFVAVRVFVIKIGRGGAIRLQHQQVVANRWVKTAADTRRGIPRVKIERAQREIRRRL